MSRRVGGAPNNIMQRTAPLAAADGGRVVAGGDSSAPRAGRRCVPSVDVPWTGEAGVRGELDRREPPQYDPLW